MRIGIAGGGHISETHARAAHAIAGLDVVAVHGTNRARVERIAGEYGATAYDDFTRFLDHPMDLVAIGSPSGLHTEQGIAAARRGLHVLVEKPIAVTVAQADALIDAADSAGVTLGVFFQGRLHPPVVELKRRLDAGEIGTPIIIAGSLRWYRPPEYYSASRWRGTWALDGGGALMNQGIHTVDLMLWLMGPVTRVHGFTATRLHAIEVEDTATAVMEFAGGALGTIEATTAAFPGYPRRLDVVGTQGTLTLDHDRGPGTSSPVVADAFDHQRVIEDFLRAIETGGAPACDGREGRRSVELVRAIYASAGERRPIALAGSSSSS